MSEIHGSKLRAEITIVCLKTRKISTHTGHYGSFSDAYAHCAAHGYRLLSYTGIY